MNNILQSLYNGEIYPLEQCHPKSAKYREICEEFCDSCDELENALSSIDPPLDKRFSAIIDTAADIAYLEASETFAQGFRLGAMLMLEILGGTPFYE